MISQNIMDDQEALGALYQLGNHRATYKRQFFAPSRLLDVSFIVGLFLYSILIITLIPFIGNGVILFLIPALVIAGLLLLEVILIFYGNHKLCVFVYDYGLIHRGRKSLLTIIYWKNVRYVEHMLKNSIWSYEGETAVWHTYIVRCTDGTLLRLDETFAKLQQLGKFIETEIARQHFPATLNTYQTGQPVVFGSLTVMQEGLSHESHMLPWSEIKSIKIFSGMIMLRRQGQRSIYVGVPNSEVFKMLVQYVKSAIAQQRFPAVLNTYQMDYAVVFGSLTVTREGVSHGSTLLPWTKLRSIQADEIYNSRLVIRKQGKRFAWAVVDLADAPQVEVFKMLMHYIGEENNP